MGGGEAMNLKTNGWFKGIENGNNEPISLIVRIPGKEILLRVIQPGEIYGIAELDPKEDYGMSNETRSFR